MNPLSLILIVALISQFTVTGAVQAAVHESPTKRHPTDVEGGSKAEPTCNQPATNLQPRSLSVSDNRVLIGTISDNDDRARGLGRGETCGKSMQVSAGVGARPPTNRAACCMPARKR